MQTLQKTSKFLICLVLISLVAPSVKADENDWVICANQNNENAVVACTRVINDDLIDETYRAAAYNNRGISQIQKKDYSSAISDYTASIKLNPNEPSTYLNRGLAFEEGLNDLDNALKDFTKAIELNSNDKNNYIARANIFNKKEDYDSAINDYNSAIELDPQNDDLISHRGFLFYQNNDYENAIKDFNEAIKLNPKSVPAFLNRGNVFFKQKKLKNANSDYNVVLKLDPNNALAHNNIGAIAFQKNNHATAIEEFNKAIKFDPKYMPAYLNRASSLLEIGGDYEKAIADCDIVIKDDPKNVDAYYFRALAFWKRNDLQRAKIDLNVSLNIISEQKNKKENLSKVRNLLEELNRQILEIKKLQQQENERIAKAEEAERQRQAQLEEQQRQLDLSNTDPPMQECDRLVSLKNFNSREDNESSLISFVDFCTKASQRFPNSLRLKRLLVSALRKNGNFDEALKLIETINEDPFALTEKGIMYFYGQGVLKNEKEAIKLFELGSNNNVPLSYLMLGYVYQYGIEVPKDPNKALDFYEQANQFGIKSVEQSIAELKLRKSLGVDEQKVWDIIFQPNKLWSFYLSEKGSCSNVVDAAKGDVGDFIDPTKTGIIVFYGFSYNKKINYISSKYDNSDGLNRHNIVDATYEFFGNKFIVRNNLENGGENREEFYVDFNNKTIKSKEYRFYSCNDDLPNIISLENVPNKLGIFMCDKYLSIIQNAIDWRRQNIPEQAAIKLADYVIDMPNLRKFLIGAIMYAYRYPTEAQKLYDTGKTKEMCIKAF